MSKLSITLEIDDVGALTALEYALEMYVESESERLKDEPDRTHAAIVKAGSILLSQIRGGRRG